MGFTKATKKKARGRVALIGPSGSGKTRSALEIAWAMGGKVALIDTEHGSASKYADKGDFDVLELDSFAPENFVRAIHDAEDAGYEIIIIDSLSHAWMGKDGALEMKDRVTKRTGNSYTAWGDVTPHHIRLIEAMLGSKCHIIATMRAKMEYVQEKDEKTGKTVVRKIGLQPVQRDGMEYEFDVVGDLTVDNDLIIGKTRCDELRGQSFHLPGKAFADIFKAWLTDGVDAPAPKLTDGLESALRVTEDEIATLREWLDSTATDEVTFLAAFGKRGTGLEGPAVNAIENLTPVQCEQGLALLRKKSERRATA